MVTFEQIQKANETIKMTQIKGKDYAEVNQRIKAFRMIYPQGAIMTELVSDVDGVCVFRATVGYYTESDTFIILGTGTAYEKESSSYINKTSYIENCETSAVGRALGMAGIGIETSVASFEEVQNAITNQQKAEQDDPTKAGNLPVICPGCGKLVKPTKYKGEAMTPKQIIDKFGCCPTCYQRMEDKK